MVPVPVPTFEKVIVPVPVPAPFASSSSKANLSKKILEFFLLFYRVSCFSRKKFENFNKIIVKCE